MVKISFLSELLVVERISFIVAESTPSEVPSGEHAISNTFSNRESCFFVLLSSVLLKIDFVCVATSDSKRSKPSVRVAVLSALVLC